MPHHVNTTISGTITHLFGHRFLVRTEHGDVLADLTAKGREQITLRLNDEVTLEGEMKPSELKVARLTRGGQTIEIAHKSKPGHHGRDHPHADASIAIASVCAAGFLALGAPRRKPKHFELLAKKQDGPNELHVELHGEKQSDRSDYRTAPSGRLGLQEDWGDAASNRSIGSQTNAVCTTP